MSVVSIHFFLGLEECLTSDVEWIVLAQILKQRVVNYIILQEILVFFVREGYLALSGAFIEQFVVAASFLLGLLALFLDFAPEGIDCTGFACSILHFALASNQALLHELGSVTGKRNT